jgi:hypothetical protein
MFTPRAFSLLLGFGCCFTLSLSLGQQSLGQQSPAVPAATQTPSPSSPAPQASAAGAAGLEFPIVLHQKIVAGKTQPGTHVDATLLVATLVSGKVIPKNAVLSGEVIESQAKTKSDPSRLSVRIDSAQWSNGSAALQIYLTPSFFPVTLDAGPNLQHGPEQSAKRTWNGMGQYPDPKDPGYKPFPAGADTGSSPTSDTPASVISKKREHMKDVESQRDSAGIVTLVSSHSNLKLDTLTTYVFASSDMAAGGAK